jgi:transposase
MKDKNYTDEFKANATRMVLVEGLTRTEVARRLETASQNVSRWVKEAQEKQQDKTENGESNVLLKKKIHELEKQNRQLQMERDILKKATAFFAKELL